MKKTIAILMILVLAGVGLFADTIGSTTVAVDASNTIKLTTTVPAQSYFGISTSPIVAASFLSHGAFVADTNVLSEIVVASQPMTNFENTTLVGFLSGINNTSSSITFGLTALDFTSETASGAIPLSVTTVPSATPVLPAATNVLGTLQNVKIFVKETTPGSIDLAPAADDWTSTVTISVTTVS